MSASRKFIINWIIAGCIGVVQFNSQVADAAGGVAGGGGLLTSDRPANVLDVYAVVKQMPTTLVSSIRKLEKIYLDNPRDRKFRKFPQPQTQVVLRKLFRPADGEDLVEKILQSQIEFKLVGPCIDPATNRPRDASYTRATKKLCFSVEKILENKVEFGNRAILRSELPSQIFKLAAHEISHATIEYEEDALLSEDIVDKVLNPQGNIPLIPANTLKVFSSQIAGAGVELIQSVQHISDLIRTLPTAQAAVTVCFQLNDLSRTMEQVLKSEAMDYLDPQTQNFVKTLNLRKSYFKNYCTVSSGLKDHTPWEDGIVSVINGEYLVPPNRPVESGFLVRTLRKASFGDLKGLALELNDMVEEFKVIVDEVSQQALRLERVIAPMEAIAIEPPSDDK